MASCTSRTPAPRTLPVIQLSPGAAYDMAPHPTQPVVYVPCGDTLRRVDAGTPSTLVQISQQADEASIEGGAFGNDELYFVTGATGGRLGVVDLETKVVRYIADLAHGYRVGVDQQNAYVLTRNPVSLDGGLEVVDLTTEVVTSPVPTSASHKSPLRIRVDDTGAYWANAGANADGSIWRLPKL